MTLKRYCSHFENLINIKQVKKSYDQIIDPIYLPYVLLIMGVNSIRNAVILLKIAHPLLK